MPLHPKRQRLQVPGTRRDWFGSGCDDRRLCALPRDHGKVLRGIALRQKAASPAELRPGPRV